MPTFTFSKYGKYVNDNCLDRCYNFDISVCVKLKQCVLQFLLLGYIYFHISDVSLYIFTHHSHQYSIFCYFPWTICSNFQATLHRISDLCSPSSFIADPNFCRTYSYTGCTFESLPKSCAHWLLLLKYQASQIASNWFLLIVLGKNWCGNCGIIWPVVSCDVSSSFLWVQCQTTSVI